MIGDSFWAFYRSSDSQRTSTSAFSSSFVLFWFLSLNPQRSAFCFYHKSWINAELHSWTLKATRTIFICLGFVSLRLQLKEQWANLEFTLFRSAVWATCYCTIGNRSEFSHTRLCRPASSRHLSDNWISIIRHQSRNGTRLQLTQIFSHQNYFLFNELRDEPRSTETRRRIIHKQRRKWRKSCELKCGSLN